MNQKKRTLEKMMPHNIEAEQSVLGCVLIDDSAAINILTDLKEDDFYVEAHKIIFESMFNIYKNTQPVDFVTLSDDLEKQNMLDSVGGLEYITLLTNFVPSASNYSHYMEIVKRGGILRRLIHASNKISEYSYTSPNYTDAVSFAEKSIFDISQSQDKSSIGPLRDSLGDVLERFEVIQKDRDSLKGLSTGFFALDKITNGLQKSDLILLAARPGFGKTSLAMNIVNNAALLRGAKCAIFSLEMPKIQLAQRSLCSVAMVSMSKALKGDLSGEEWKALWSANDKLSKAQIFVDDSSLNSPVDILSKCRRLKAEHGLDLIMIDYLQLMTMPGKGRENRQQEISEISRSLKILAKELDVPVLVLSQLSRAVEARKDHRPMLSDLRESGAIEQDADIVLFIHRSDMYNEEEAVRTNSGVIVDLIIAKHRNGELGSLPLNWIGEITTFTNLNRDSNMRSLEGAAPPPQTKNKNNVIDQSKETPATVEEEKDLPEISSIEDNDITDIF